MSEIDRTDIRDGWQAVRCATEAMAMAMARAVPEICRVVWEETRKARLGRKTLGRAGQAEKERVVSKTMERVGDEVATPDFYTEYRKKLERELRRSVAAKLKDEDAEGGSGNG
jgi:hypothetical protein